jgi:hypothetical protein
MKTFELVAAERLGSVAAVETKGDRVAVGPGSPPAEGWRSRRRGLTSGAAP